MKRQPTQLLGAASLFTAFCVLLMTMLALLSLSQAKADRRIADTAAQRVQEYYAADLEAGKLYAGIRAGQISPEVTQEDGLFRYRIPVSQYQTLFVEIEAQTGQILRWQVVAHPEAPNEELPVWQG